MSSTSKSTLLPENGIIEVGGRTLKVEKRLSSGLTGEVYAGTLIEDERPTKVAIKVMKTLEFATAHQFFEQESQTLAIIRGYEADADDDLRIAPEYHGQGSYEKTPFFMMEFIDGVEIPDLLAKYGRLPEAQALRVGWHLYRTLNIMHNRLKKTYIDLKFENLWWVGSAENGQLKLTDFGTLEDIKGDPDDLNDRTAQRGIRRDLLLSGVYLCAMLTGYTLDYSLGQLRERAEPIIYQAENLSWGTRQYLFKLLHRNADARPKTAVDSAKQLANLTRIWSAAPEKNADMGRRFLSLAEDDPESKRGLDSADIARTTLDIALMQLGGEDADIVAMIERADAIITLNDYIYRGRALFTGGSYSSARKMFEDGRDWSANIAPLSWWSYLARIGEDVPSSQFDRETRDKAVAAVELMQQHKWQYAHERLLLLQPTLQSDALDYLLIHCKLLGALDEAVAAQGTTDYAGRVVALERVETEIQRLPEEEQQYVREQFGDVRPELETARDLDETIGAWMRRMDAIGSEPTAEAVALLNEAITLEPRNPRTQQVALALSRAALDQNKPQFARDLARTGLRQSSDNSDLQAVLTQARALLTAEAAIAAQDQELFFAQVRTASPSGVNQLAVLGLIDKAANSAEAVGSSAFLRALAAYDQEQFGGVLADDLSYKADEIDRAHDEEHHQRVDAALLEAQAYIAVYRGEDRRQFADFYRNLTIARYLGILNERIVALKPAQAAVEAATALSAVSGDYRRSEIDTLRSEIEREIEVNSAEITRRTAEMDKIKTDLVQQFETLVESGQPTTQESATRKEWESIATNSFIYLTRFDAEDEAVLAIQSKALAALDWYGKTGWVTVRDIATQRIEAIDSKLTEARSKFDSGDSEAAAASLDAFDKTYGGGQEAQTLRDLLLLVPKWETWQQDMHHAFATDRYNAETLSSLRREWLPFTLPVTYWRDSAAETYLNKAQADASKNAKYFISNYARSEYAQQLRDWTDATMTRNMSPVERDTATPLRQWNGTDNYLRTAFGAAMKGFDSLAKVVEETATPDDIDTTLPEINADNWRRVRNAITPPPKKRSGVTRIAWAGLGLVAMLVLALGGVLLTGIWPPHVKPKPVGTSTSIAVIPNTPVEPTATPIPPTNTPVPPTNTPVPPTATPTLTPTPIPEVIQASDSRFHVEDPEGMQPVAPIQAENYWLLGLNDALVVPELTDDTVWTTSELDGIGSFSQTITATSPISITWAPDTYSNEGTYQIFILDSAIGSGGTYSFTVALNSEAVEPWRGINEIILDDETHGQETSEWLSIGVYEVAQGNQLSIQTVVEPRDEPFALPYVLIAELRENERLFLEQLSDAETSGRPMYSMLDDDRIKEYQVFSGERVVVSSIYNWEISEDLHTITMTQSISPTAFAWNSNYRFGELVAGRDTGHVFEWTPIGRLPAGDYELKAWIPSENATVEATYDLFADSVLVERSNAAIIDQSSFSNQWVTLGRWVLSEEAAVTVRVTARTDANSGREEPWLIVADAVVLLLVEVIEE